MGDLFEIKGTAKLIRKKTAFRNYDPVLRRHLTKRLKAATAPLRREIEASALETLPKAGGLNVLAAKSLTSTRVVLQGKRTGVRLTTRNPHSIRQLDRGRVRHPLYGNRKFWYTQTVEPGWWSKPVEESKPEATVAVRAALDEMLKELGR